MQVGEWLEGVDIKHKRLKLSKVKVKSNVLIILYLRLKGVDIKYKN